MLFDPDAGKTIEEIIVDVWEHKISSHRRAEILAIAEESGRNLFASELLEGRCGRGKALRVCFPPQEYA